MMQTTPAVKCPFAPLLNYMHQYTHCSLDNNYQSSLLTQKQCPCLFSLSNAMGKSKYTIICV